TTLLATQLGPLCVGLAAGRWLPALAARLLRPAALLSKLLNVLVIGFILVTRFPTLAAIRPMAIVGMLTLLAASLATGWLLGGPARGTRRALAIPPALRNVGPGLAIAAGAFAGTPPVTATLAYGLVAIAGTALFAAALAARPPLPEGIPAKAE